jgi:membrane-bound serine protease (ClpP class)
MVDERIVVEGLDDSSKVITLTTDEAIKWGYCEKVIPSFQELITYKNLDNAEIITLQPSSLDEFYSFLNSPVTIYFIGLLALVAFVLIALELFVIPGFGVAGLSGIVLIIISLMLSVLRSTNFDVADTSDTKLYSIIASFLIGLSVVVMLLIIFRKIILNLKLFDSVVLKSTIGSKVKIQQESSDLANLQAAQGVTASALRPMGKIIINGTTFEAKTYGEFIDSGAKVKVISIENQYLVVKPI